MTLSTTSGLFKFHVGYYHYATAGGAKFWRFTPSFCPAFTQHCHTVEGIPHGIANYPIHSRSLLTILFLPCVTLSPVICTQYTSTSSTNIFPFFRTLGIVLAVSQRRSLVALFSQVTWCPLYAHVRQMILQGKSKRAGSDIFPNGTNS
jgi:hypothetical protein